MSNESSTRVLTEAQVKQVEALAAYLTADQIAAYFGMARSTYFEVMKRQPEVAAAYRMGRAKIIAVLASGLVKRARAGDNLATIFYLKTQAGWREKEVADEDDTEDAPPTSVTIVAKNARRD